MTTYGPAPPVADEYVRIEGLAQVTAALRALPAEFGSKNGGPLRSALYRGAVIIKEEAIARAPRDTGNLAANIYVFRDPDPRGSTGAAERFVVGVRSGKGRKSFKIRSRGKFAGRSKVTRQGDAFYWRFVEFGTQSQQAQPFIRPAFENRKRDALIEITQKLSAGVKSAARRARQRSGR